MKAKYKSKKKISRTRKLLDMLETQKYRCALSGRPLVPENAVLDHIHPISADGSIDDFNNLQILRTEVNLAKSNFSESEFLRICADVTKNNPKDLRRLSDLDWIEARLKQ